MAETIYMNNKNMNIRAWVERNTESTEKQLCMHESLHQHKRLSVISAKYLQLMSSATTTAGADGDVSLSCFFHRTQTNN